MNGFPPPGSLLATRDARLGPVSPPIQIDAQQNDPALAAVSFTRLYVPRPMSLRSLVCPLLFDTSSTRHAMAGKVALYRVSPTDGRPSSLVADTAMDWSFTFIRASANAPPTTNLVSFRADHIWMKALPRTVVLPAGEIFVANLCPYVAPTVTNAFRFQATRSLGPKHDFFTPDRMGTADFTWPEDFTGAAMTAISPTDVGPRTAWWRWMLGGAR